MGIHPWILGIIRWTLFIYLTNTYCAMSMSNSMVLYELQNTRRGLLKFFFPYLEFAGSIPRTLRNTTWGVLTPGAEFLRADSIISAALHPSLPAPSDISFPKAMPPRSKAMAPLPRPVSLRDKEHSSQTASLLGQGGIPGEPRVLHPPEDARDPLAVVLIFLSHRQCAFPPNCLPSRPAASSPSSQPPLLHHIGPAQPPRFV